jgi:hypothetical protein
MTNSDNKMMIEELTKAIDTLTFLESDLRSAITRSHGGLALASIPLTAAIKQACELRQDLSLTLALLVETSQAQ